MPHVPRHGLFFSTAWIATIILLINSKDFSYIAERYKLYLISIISGLSPVYSVISLSKVFPTYNPTKFLRYSSKYLSITQIFLRVSLNFSSMPQNTNNYPSKYFSISWDSWKYFLFSRLWIPEWEIPRGWGSKEMKISYFLWDSHFK